MADQPEGRRFSARLAPATDLPQVINEPWMAESAPPQPCHLSKKCLFGPGLAVVSLLEPPQQGLEIGQIRDQEPG
jgi:hypothetical protein